MDYTQRRKEQGQKTEAAILSAALELMRVRGFEDVTVRDICKAAGITTGAFYHHFRSKEDLFAKGFTPLDRYMEQVLKDAPADDPEARLREIIRHYAKFMVDCGELTAQYYQRRLADPNMAPMDCARYIHRVMIACFTQAREQGILTPSCTPERAADFCFRHFRGLVVDWLLHRREYSLLDKMMGDYILLSPMLRAEERCVQ